VALLCEHEEGAGGPAAEAHGEGGRRIEARGQPGESPLDLQGVRTAAVEGVVERVRLKPCGPPPAPPALS
jgi:hypothetical protein